MKRLLRALEVLAWFAFFAFAALVLVLRYWVLPDIERYRGDIVAAISRSVGLPVKVGGIEAGWQGLRPRIRLSDVRILDAQGREALVLPAVENVVAWRSLAHRDLRLHSLVIDAPRLSVRRDAAGALTVAGVRLSGNGDGRFGEWLLGQEEIVVRDAEIVWHDEKRDAPPLALSALNLRLRNSGEQHALGLAAQPPPGLGSTLELRAQLEGDSSTDPGAWNGRLYVELGSTDLAAWRPWLDYPVDLRAGRGALRLWASLEKGTLRQATADVALEGVVAQLDEALPLLELASVHGRLRGRRAAGAWEISGRRVSLAAADGEPMPPTDFRLASKRGGGALSARQVELAPLVALADALPMPQRLRTLIAEAAPRGRLDDASLEWQGALADPTHFAARAHFTDLAMQARGELPGFAGLTGSIDATETAGRLSLASRQAELDLPGVFPEPRIALDSLTGRVHWERYGTALAVRLPSLAFANADLAGSASGSYSRAGSTAGRIDLSATLTRADGSRVAKYLPHGSRMGEKTRAWLASSILAGEASDVRLRLRGDLRDFPFADPASGEFEVSARVQGGVLEYGRDWPRIHDIDAELLFRRDHMEIVGRSGTTLGARLSNVRVSIPHMAPSRAVLVIVGEAEGPTREFLRFVASSPVRRATGALTEELSAAGRGRLALKIELPLADRSAVKVAGEYDFAGNSVKLHEELPVIEDASGKLAFSESAFAVRGARGRTLGGPVAISGGSRTGGFRFVARGEATVSGARPALDHPWMRYLSGAAPYVATVELAEGRLARFVVESSLLGVASELPPPFAKRADEALALRVELTPGPSGARERVDVALGELAAAQFQRRRRGEDMPVRRAAIWLSPVAGQPIRLPERPGTLIYGSLEALDADRWLPLVSSGEGGVASAALDLRIGALDLYGKRVHNLSLRAGADAGGWSAAVKADELAGDVAYHGADGGRLVARLEHLTLPEDLPGAPARAEGEPGDVPAVDVVAERFRYRGRQLGRIALLAHRRAGEWRVDKLELVAPEATLSARGSWRGGSPARTALRFEIEASDAGKFLERTGNPGLVRAGRVQMKGALAWQGTPLALHYPSLSGEIELHAQDGQFLEVEPGIGKLISLMSLQQLPRRIVLDFRDVFSQGFRFDRINARAGLEEGLMTVKQFRMQGSAADVRIAGEADLAHETQELSVRVIPALGSTASTAVAAIVNPVAGVAAAIAQQVLKDPLGQIFAYDYSITGSWVDPKVVKVAVGPPDPEAGVGTP